MLQAQIYIDKDDLNGTQPLYEFILKFLIKHKIAGATVFEGKAGYGGNKRVNSPSDLFSFDNSPMMITFIDDSEKVRSVLTELRKEVKGGFIVTNPVQKWQ